MTPDDETITPELTPVGFSDALVKLWAEDVERAGHVVLFVDDCSDTLHMLEVMFRDDYVVHLADSAEAAVRLLSTGIEPHAIVSDQMMPGMRGVQFLKLMSETNPLSARVLFSAHDDMRAVRDAIKYAQIHRYVGKPLDEKFREAIGEAVAIGLLLRRRAWQVSHG